MNYPPYDGSQPCATDPETFFPNEVPITKVDRAIAREDTERAKSLCSGCKFINACAEYSLYHDVVGVWGGLDHKDRKILRQRRKLAPPLPITTNDRQIRRDQVLSMAGTAPTREIASRTGLAQSTVQSIIRDRRLEQEARAARITASA